MASWGFFGGNFSMTSYTAPYQETTLYGFPGGNGTYGPGPGGTQSGIVGVGVYVTLQQPLCPVPSLPCASLGNLGGFDWEAALLAGTYPSGSPTTADTWSILGLQADSVWP